MVPGLSIVALTATATERVQNDIIKQLKLRHLVKIKAPVFRENLFYDVQFKVIFLTPEKLLHPIQKLVEKK